MDDQQMATVQDALMQVTGVSIKGMDRGRNELSARGFAINNFQLDGIPTVSGNVGIETTNKGQDVATVHPRRSLNLFTKYDLSNLVEGLAVGGGLNWQSRAPAQATNPVTGQRENIGQPAYVLANLMASFQISEPLSVQLNVNNLFDKTYWADSWSAFTYGEPRNFKLGVKYKF